MKRRILSLLLCLCTLAVLLPGAALAEDGESPAAPETRAGYEIGPLTVRDKGGESLEAIPDGPFLVTVPVTRTSGEDGALVFLAAYDPAGKFRGMMYFSLRNVTEGATAEITLPVENAAGDVAELKAFAVPSFRDLKPLGPVSVFPAGKEDPGFPAALFAVVESEEPNKCLSPVSVQYALGLVRPGAAGIAREQLDALLEGADFSRWNKVLASAGDGPTVEVANSIWFDSSVTPTKTYLDTVRRDFDAESQTLELSALSSLDVINGWVRTKTHDLIKSILDEPLGKDAAAVLLNALYFKGDWAVPFEPEYTRDQVFHGRSGTDRNVPFMHDTRDNMTYIDTKTCQGVALPYKGGGWWMLALLPKDGGTAESLAAEDFGALLKGAGGAYVSLALPKFTVEASYDLTQPLQKLGLTAAFTNGDFSPMGTCTNGPIVLSKVLQKTYLRVDEKGTEAAAVTAVIGKAGASMVKPVKMVFDRPFLCCLWNSEIGQPLFLAAVNELG